MSTDREKKLVLGEVPHQLIESGSIQEAEELLKLMGHHEKNGIYSGDLSCSQKGHDILQLIREIPKPNGIVWICQCSVCGQIISGEKSEFQSYCVVEPENSDVSLHALYTASLNRYQEHYSGIPEVEQAEELSRQLKTKYIKK